jgi:hypothetical protein
MAVARLDVEASLAQGHQRIDEALRPEYALRLSRTVPREKLVIGIDLRSSLHPEPVDQ